MGAIQRSDEPIATTVELVQEIVTHRNVVLEKSADLVISTDDDFTAAGEILKAIRIEQKVILARITPTVTAANEAHKTATALRAELMAPALEAESTVKGAMAGYVDKREAEAQAQRQEAEAAQRKRDEEERERQRRIREAEDKRIAEAAELEAAGKTEEAEAVLESHEPEPPPLPEPVPAPQIQKPRSADASVRTIWSMEIVDKRELVEAWLRGEVPEDLVEIDQGKLNQIAKSMKAASKVPGCKAVRRTGISGR